MINIPKSFVFLLCVFIFGFSYVAARALDMLNFTPLNNKPIRIMHSHRDPSIRKSGTGNIFIKVIMSFFISFLIGIPDVYVSPILTGRSIVCLVLFSLAKLKNMHDILSIPLGKNFIG